MDSKREEKSEAEVKEGGFRSKLKGLGSFIGKDMFFRADKIDLNSLDIQLEKRLNKAWSEDKVENPKEEWEIVLSELEIRYEVAQGTYGTVYTGVCDGQDVAGT
ncbi:hypothetical protein IEQ34_013769 [Dendrobium chrysotoxum]|uniref:Uncharacterized protein n=1 Tax=Dendrobium chrysotoxum TaxID=161865 RepID=A0AAV7GRX3_DENCH|nr:hypothetical protein IEQ34_013769 [Dendrobium chrysotoxum]